MKPLATATTKEAKPEPGKHSASREHGKQALQTSVGNVIFCTLLFSSFSHLLIAMLVLYVVCMSFLCVLVSPQGPDGNIVCKQKLGEAASKGAKPPVKKK